jgi:phosphohistidine swiveling domain-containing protein
VLMKKQILPFDPKSEVLLWGPTPGRNYYASGFSGAIFFHFPKEYPGYFWPKTLYLLKGDKIFWVNGYPDMRREGMRVFKKYMLPKKSRIRLRERWKGVVKELDLFEERFSQFELEKLADAELRELGDKFWELINRFWTITIPQELGNYGSDYFLEQKIKKYFPGRLERMKAMEILTSPEELSFYQKEELALAKTKNLRKHQNKYFWIQNSYNGSKVLSAYFFKKRKKDLRLNLEKVFKSHIRNVKRRKAMLQKKYHLPMSIMNIAEGLSYGIAWQDERKGNIFKYIHYLDLFAKEVSRRKKYIFSKLLNLDIPEVVAAIERDVRPELRRRGNRFGYIYTKGRVRLLDGPLTKKYWKLYGKEKINPNIKEIRGIVASKGKKGKISGVVKIVTDPFKVKGFKKGDILVSPFTAPEYLFLMKKAAAVITDSGGLTSHAAIVSRELGIPCIVGTKIATQVLKSGDRVEVDANKGIVKIINKV